MTFSLLRCLITAVAIAALWVGAIPAQASDDQVILSAGEKGQSKLSGEVLEYNGRELRIRTSTGERKVPAERVVRVETSHCAEEKQADDHYRAGRYTQAVTDYTAALRTEKRLWVARDVMIQLSRAHRALGNFAAAGDAFLKVVKSDPQTRHFAAIPLAWQGADRGSDRLVPQAERWLGDEHPVAALLGASHLLLTTRNRPAEAKLEELSKHDDPRIAHLARAQFWRGKLASVDEYRAELWLTQVEECPAPLRAGPYFIAGRALARVQRHEAAALALLRAPLLFPDDGSLAARALVEAGQSLEALGQTAEAARLYAEVKERYAQEPAAAEAEQRLEKLRAADRPSSPGRTR